MAFAPTPLASPNQRRSQYLSEALKSMRAEPERIGGYGDLAARLAAQYLTQRASEKTDEAVGVEARNAALARRQALFGGIEGLDVGGEMQPVPSSRLGNPIAGALRMIGGGRQEQQAPSAPSRPAPEFNVMQGPAAPAGDVQGRPLPQIDMMPQDGGQDPRMGPAAPAPAQPAPMQADPNQIPPEIVQQAKRFLALGTPEGEQEALKLVQGWQQQQAMLAQMPPEIRNDPVLRYAFMQNPEAVAESIGYQYRPQVIAAGGIQSVIGSGDRVSAPQTIQFGDTLTRVDPLSPTPQTIATRGPTFAERTGRISAERLQPVAVPAGGAVGSFNPATGETRVEVERAPAVDPARQDRAEGAQNTAIDRSVRVRAAVEDARPLVGLLSSGVLAGIIPFNQSQADLKAAIEPILASLSFAELQQMRADSPTGGALGSIAVRELDLLGATIASLSTEQSPQRLLAALDRVDNHMATIEAVTRADRGMPLTPDLARRLPPGTEFIGTDGQRRVVQ